MPSEQHHVTTHGICSIQFPRPTPVYGLSTIPFDSTTSLKGSSKPRGFRNGTFKFHRRSLPLTSIRSRISPTTRACIRCQERFHNRLCVLCVGAQSFFNQIQQYSVTTTTCQTTATHGFLFPISLSLQRPHHEMLCVTPTTGENTFQSVGHCIDRQHNSIMLSGR